MGNYSRKFEREIAKIFKKLNAYMYSGSSALFIGIESFNFPKNSEGTSLNIWYNYWKFTKE